MSANAAKVLVLDDHMRVAKIVVRMLSLAEVRAEAFDEADALARRVEAGPPPALVILDQVAPRWRGTRVAEQLRSNGFAGQIIIMSGLVGGPERASLTSSGASFLEKPFTYDTLVATVSEALAEASPGHGESAGGRDGEAIV